MTVPFDTMLRAYLGCALWSSHDDDGTPLDDRYDINGIAEGSVIAAGDACSSFRDAAGSDLADIDDAQAGHDFWLTRNHHGAGFWDRGLGERGERLTRIAESFGESDAYVGDDGKVYLS